MDNSFNVNIVSSQAPIYSGKVSSVVLPCELGYLGILANHRPLIASIKSGKITLTETTGKVVNFNYEGRGFLEVLKNNVTVVLHQHLISA